MGCSECERSRQWGLRWPGHQGDASRVCQRKVGGTFWQRRQRERTEQGAHPSRRKSISSSRPSWSQQAAKLLYTGWGAPVQSEKGPEPRLHPHLISCCPSHHLNSSGLSILALEIKALNLVISKDPGLVLCACTAGRSPWVVTETRRHDTHRLFSGRKIF